MSKTFPIEVGVQLSLEEIQRALEPRTHLELTPKCAAHIERYRQYLEKEISESDAYYYGVNTGFGSLYNVRIPNTQIKLLQANLIRSHSAGAGKPIQKEVARIVLLLKIITLAQGYSGVRRSLVDQLITYYNHDLIPVMYEFGSLGASGDLAPLAHLSLTLIGEGEFYTDQGISPAGHLLEESGIRPIVLQAKEGLALINGTQFSAGIAVHAIALARHLMYCANLSAALSCDAFDCNLQPFDQRIHDVRPHRGQKQVATIMRKLLADSNIANGGYKQLQDPYSFRCVPQVHGASLDTLIYATTVVTTEINSVTDNPLIYADSEVILSGGNFHAQPLALVMDFLAIAIAELGNISERRTYQLLSGNRELPNYLTPEAGIQSGLMIAQYTAASIVNKNKMLCTPVSVDSIVSSKGQEDHVSMSANAAMKLIEVCNNTMSVLAIEWMTAMQALDFRRPKRTSPLLENLRDRYRRIVPFIESDQMLHEYIAQTEKFLSELSTQND